MPPPISSSRYLTRKHLLDSFSEVHRIKWKEMRTLQNTYNKAIYGDNTNYFFALCMTIIGVGFLFLEIFTHFKDHTGFSGVSFFALPITGIFLFSFFSEKRAHRRNLPPDALEKINTLKDSTELQEVFTAFKTSGEEWTPGDDKTCPSDY